MNYWTKLSIEFANQRNYLDELFTVYPLAPDIIRDIDTINWNNIENAFNHRDDNLLLERLLDLELFPIKDSYISFLRKDRAAITRNPRTVQRICSKLYSMGLDEIYKQSSQPKETNRQIGPLFHRWIASGALGFKHLTEESFISTKEDAILKGSDAQIKKFAQKYLHYQGNKGLDFLARIKGRHVVGQAKFISDFGGNQNNQFADGLALLKDARIRAITIAIYDGVLYLKRRGNPYNYLVTHRETYNIFSSLLLRDFLYSL